MEFIREISKQGVVCNYATTNQFKSNYLSIDFILPLTLENATGMSLLAGVMSRGCKAYPRLDLISQFLAENYGASLSIRASKAGEMEIFSFAVNYLDNDCAIDGEDIRSTILSFLQEMIFFPLVDKDGFCSEYVEQEKKNLVDRIEGLFNDKRIYSLERCRALMCSKEAYGINEMGDLETLRGFDSIVLYTFYKKMLADAQIIMSYVGKGNGVFLKEFINRFSYRKAENIESEIAAARAKIQEVIEPMNLNQSKLNLGFRLGEQAKKDGAACRVFNVLYGGSANSKLFMNVRERLSLCYYCSSMIDRFKNVMFVSSGVESEKYEEARAEIEAQLKAIATGDFTDDEFESAKSYLIDSVRGSLDSKGALASFMTANALRDEEKTPEQEIEEISAVDRDAVIAVAKGTSLDTVYFLKGVQDKE